MATTRYAPIEKPRTSLRATPNLVDYDRHSRGARRQHVALRCISKDGAARDVTYGVLAELTSRFANALRKLGIDKGDRVFVVSSRILELYVACLGTLKNRSVFAPLFSAFGPEPIAARIALGDGKVLVTTEALYKKKIAKIRDELRSIRHVVLIGSGGSRASVPGALDFATLLDDASPSFDIAPTDPEDLAILHFTSGTTGKPKGAMHVHRAVVAHHATGKLALDLHPDDVFWCTADPGWVTGTSYGILSPLTLGVTSIVDEAEFDADRWYAILRDHGVTVWYTAPTAVRMMMRAGSDAARRYDLRKLRFVASVGEPLNPEAVLWGVEALGLPIHDNWWQTETGGIMVANYASMPIRPGSMGKPLPGVEAAVVRRKRDGSVDVEDRPDVEGELALRPGWPSMFRGYIGDPERYAKCFQGGWYLTGDLARRDAEGYFWFVGRVDDVKPGIAADDALAKELLGFARARLGPAVAPKEIAFVAQLPRTRSGKIMRRLLKARELGLPEGDTSTLEAGA